MMYLTADKEGNLVPYLKGVSSVLECAGSHTVVRTAGGCPHPRTRELLWSTLTSNSEMRVLPVWGQFYGPKPRQNTTRWATRAHSFVSLTGLFMTFTWGNKTRYSRERPSRFLLVDDDYYETYSIPYYLFKHNIKFLNLIINVFI